MPLKKAYFPYRIRTDKLHTALGKSIWRKQDHDPQVTLRSANKTIALIIQTQSLQVLCRITTSRFSSPFSGGCRFHIYMQRHCPEYLYRLSICHFRKSLQYFLLICVWHVHYILHTRATLYMGAFSLIWILNFHHRFLSHWWNGLVLISDKIRAARGQVGYHLSSSTYKLFQVIFRLW